MGSLLKLAFGPGAMKSYLLACLVAISSGALKDLEQFRYDWQVAFFRFQEQPPKLTHVDLGLPIHLNGTVSVDIHHGTLDVTATLTRDHMDAYTKMHAQLDFENGFFTFRLATRLNDVMPNEPAPAPPGWIGKLIGAQEDACLEIRLAKPVWPLPTLSEDIKYMEKHAVLHLSSGQEVVLDGQDAVFVDNLIFEKSDQHLLGALFPPVGPLALFCGHSDIRCGALFSKFELPSRMVDLPKCQVPLTTDESQAELAASVLQLAAASLPRNTAAHSIAQQMLVALPRALQKEEASDTVTMSSLTLAGVVTLVALSSASLGAVLARRGARGAASYRELTDA